MMRRIASGDGVLEQLSEMICRAERQIPGETKPPAGIQEFSQNRWGLSRFAQSSE
jgi:hypothetical protein